MPISFDNTLFTGEKYVKPILNIGCGGYSTHKQVWYGDVRIDIHKFPNVTIVMDAHKLGFRDRSFRKIVAYEVLEHLDSPIEALKEIRRVLSDDGIVEVTVPNIWYWRLLISCWLGTSKPKITSSDHKQVWDIYTFQMLAKQAGLYVTKIDWLDWYGPPKNRKYAKLERLIRLFLPKHLKYTHVSFLLEKSNI